MSKTWTAAADIKKVMSEIIQRKIKRDGLSLRLAGYELGVSTATVFAFVNDCEKPTLDTYIHALKNIGHDVDFGINEQGK